jgi:hypothetical protein
VTKINPVTNTNFLQQHPITKRHVKMAAKSGMVNPAIFQDLQARVDEDTAARDVGGGL